VTYSNSTTMIGDHGGFAHDDTNVILLVSKPGCTAQTISATASTAEVAPTILAALGLDPTSLDAVKAEGTPVLPGLSEQFGH
jgi:arylsulfatase A-like enzyme